MSTTATTLFNNSELSLAAYGDLELGSTSTDSNIAALKEAGMSATEATEFAKRYTNVVAVMPDTFNGFSATVFKSVDGQLTVAIRGTAGVADISEDTLLASHGAAYDQIVDMYNWWQKATHTSGDPVNQFKLQLVGDLEIPKPTGGISLYADGNGNGSWYLVPAAQAAATGELAGQADLNSIDVTGHSLGGHLASG